jgi:O-antigen/teichoic acid export membrane protein
MIADNGNSGQSPIGGSGPIPAIPRVGKKPSSTGDSPNQHFSTGHLLTNLKSRTVSSGVVTGIAQAAQFGLNLLSIVILARLLSPQDFGLVAMVLTIMGFLRIFNDAGLSTATVQREEITHAQVSNLFWTNVALGGLVSLVLAASAPAIAWFYREPRLVGVTLCLSFTFVLSSSTVQHLALLKRQMQFKEIALIQVGSAAAGVLVGIGMAWRNYGYWSLVGMQLTTPAVAFLLTWLISSWRPQWLARRSGTRSLLGFGANLTASSFIWSIARGADGLLIGRFYGSASLGLYSRASALLVRPIEQFMAPLEAVLVPTLSRLIIQPERYRRVVLQVFEVVAVISFLFTGLLLALAEPLTFVVLGPKWSEAAPIFAGFALVALFTPMGSVGGWLLTSQGRGKDILRSSSISSVVAVASFLAGLRYGPTGVAVAYSASCLLIILPLIYYIAGQSGPVTSRDLWVRFFTYLPIWVVVCGTTWTTQKLVATSDPLMQLLICVPAGLLCGLAFIYIYPPTRRVASSLVALAQEFKIGRGCSE